MNPARQLEEVLSWRLMTELWRRFPGRYALIETHPGGGQYDCLNLIEFSGSIRSVLDLIRGGGDLHFITAEEGRLAPRRTGWETKQERGEAPLPVRHQRS